MASPSKDSANDAVELEAMRKDDSSWHPCQVSLCPSGVGLIVDYGYNDSEDIILDKEEALTRLRIRSLPLLGDDCSNIKQGEHVLARQESQSKSPFFDAEVEKVHRIRHSVRVHCRCTFMVKWLHQDFRGTFIVPSSSIMKLATKGIDAHPIISAFLTTVKTFNCSSISPLPTLVKDMDYEMDLHELLGKQIEEISNSVDASKKKITEDLLMGVKVTKGQIQCRAVAASKRRELHVQVPPGHNHLKRSTRSSNKLPTEVGVKDPPMPAPSIQEEFPESKSPLNPLAARAALASLMSKLPRNLEVSIYHEEGKCFTYSSNVSTHNQDSMGSLNGTNSYNSSVVNTSSMIDKLSSKIEAASLPPVLKHDNIVKSLFPTKGWENEDKNPKVTDPSFTCSTSKRKISQPIKATRLTRAAVQKGIVISDDDIERKTCVEEMKLSCGTNKRRLTRSTEHTKEEIQTIETTKLMEESISAKYTESDSSDQSDMGRESFVLKDKKMVAEIKNISNTRRLTRSAVTGNKTVEAIQRLEENKFSEPVESDLSEENITVLDNNVLERKKSISSPRHAEFSLPPTEERDKKRKMANACKTTKKTEGNVDHNGESSQGLKRKSTSSIKPELRSSPRLRFLTRTRSQNKS